MLDPPNPRAVSLAFNPLLQPRLQPSQFIHSPLRRCRSRLRRCRSRLRRRSLPVHRYFVAFLLTKRTKKAGIVGKYATQNMGRRRKLITVRDSRVQSNEVRDSRVQPNESSNAFGSAKCGVAIEHFELESFSSSKTIVDKIGAVGILELFKGLEAFDRKPRDKLIIQKVANAYEMLGLADEKMRIMEKYNHLFEEKEPTEKYRRKSRGAKMKKEQPEESREVLSEEK